MPREQKVGFTILILIVGFTAAFCFRRQPEGRIALPALQDESRLNQLITEYQLRPLLPGIDTDEPLKPSGQFEQYLANSIEKSRRASTTHQDVPDPIQSVAPHVIASENSSEILTQRKSTLTNQTARNANSTQTISTKRPRTGRQFIHIVKPGETLSEIAQKYYGSASRFYEIYEANQDILSEPNELKLKMKLVIPVHAGAKEKPEIIKEARNTSTSAISPKGQSSEKKSAGPKGTVSQKSNLAKAGSSARSKSKKKLFIPMKHSPFSAKPTGKQVAKDLAEQTIDSKLK
ncbi:MAG: LysM peptidoglycan-binding domain-containing protein [Planctomycetaceae bacterium]|nr:LysM peptidoglycan-binding domain-containing protein [Planctomycetaceae bacterium]